MPAPGDRILARIDAGDGPVPSYTARPMKILDKPRRGQIGIVRLDEGGARLVPIDRKTKEMRIDSGDLGDARDGDLVEVSVKVSGRLMIQKAKVIAVIGNPSSEGAVSMIAIHNLEIPYRFPASVVKEAEAAGEATLKGREDWRHIPLITIDPPDAKDHDDAVHAEPDTDPRTPAGTSSPSPSPTSPPMSARAPRSTARRTCAATRSTSPTASCRCCPSASPTTSAR